MKQIIFIIALLSFLISCQKEEISIGNKVADTFFLDEKDNSMPIYVFGNTASKTFMLMVHGGPGGDALIYRDSLVKNTIESDFAVVYWDQRSAGASQGNYSLDKALFDDVATDFEKVVSILHHRYGKDISLFVNGHSWGGFLTPYYLVKGDNQKNIKGWIQTDGAHDIPLLNEYLKEMLISKSTVEIEAKRNVEKWTEIQNFAKGLTLPASFEQTNQLNTYAGQAEGLTSEVKGSLDLKETFKNYVKSDAPVSAILNPFKLLPNTYNGKKMFELVAKGSDLRSKLPLIKVPSLILFGEWDFICPPKLGEDVASKIGSSYIKKIIYPRSGHSPMISADKYKYWADVKEFINKFK
jgi:pimeloyl-ACP methyl ester carboxylesterase